jgi:hypothetical protein
VTRKGDAAAAAAASPAHSDTSARSNRISNIRDTMRTSPTHTASSLITHRIVAALTLSQAQKKGCESVTARKTCGARARIADYEQTSSLALRSAAIISVVVLCVSHLNSSKSSGSSFVASLVEFDGGMRIDSLQTAN